MTDISSAKKDVQKLQRAIVDGLEDVKAQDIQVFDTEHITSLFERVIVASGTSNRQTKALAASVRDAVREAGFAKPRIEGEDNGEWIIVDCGAAVAHIMQPTIRQYYHLEELWGDKPVKLKLGAVAPQAKASRAAALAAAQSEAKDAPKGRTAERTAARNAARKAGKDNGEVAAKAPAKKAAAKKAVAKKAQTNTAVKAEEKTTAKKSPTKPSARAAGATKPAGDKKPASGKTAVKATKAPAKTTRASAKAVRPATKSAATTAAKPAAKKSTRKA
jgi:ribosome-associated protein